LIAQHRLEHHQLDQDVMAQLI